MSTDGRERILKLSHFRVWSWVTLYPRGIAHLYSLCLHNLCISWVFWLLTWEMHCSSVHFDSHPAFVARCWRIIHPRFQHLQPGIKKLQKTILAFGWISFLKDWTLFVCKIWTVQYLSQKHSFLWGNSILPWSIKTWIIGLSFTFSEVVDVWWRRVTAIVIFFMLCFGWSWRNSSLASSRWRYRWQRFDGVSKIVFWRFQHQQMPRLVNCWNVCYLWKKQMSYY